MTSVPPSAKRKRSQRERDRARERMRGLRADQGFQERQRRLRAEPSYRAHIRENARQRHQERMRDDPEYRARIQETARRGRLRRRKDPAYIEREREQKREYERHRREHPEHKRRSRDSTRKYVYGCSGAEVRRLLDAQNHACPGCGLKIDERAHVDHCHTTNRVRGVLCPRCNKALGFSGDNPEILRALIAYLTNPPAWALAHSASPDA